MLNKRPRRELDENNAVHLHLKNQWLMNDEVEDGDAIKSTATEMSTKRQVSQDGPLYIRPRVGLATLHRDN